MYCTINHCTILNVFCFGFLFWFLNLSIFHSVFLQGLSSLHTACLQYELSLLRNNGKHEDFHECILMLAEGGADLSFRQATVSLVNKKK